MDNNPKIGIVLGLITAILVGVIWYLIAKYTGYEAGIIAIGVGYAVARVLLRYLGKSKQTTIFAIVFTAIGLLVAKGLIRYDVIPTEALKTIEAEQTEVGEYMSKEVIRAGYPFKKYLIDDINPTQGKESILTILFYIIALSTAYQVINKKEKIDGAKEKKHKDSKDKEEKII